MNVEKFCFACNIKTDWNIYLKDRTVCKSCYKKTEKNHNNAPTQIEINISNHKPKHENINRKTSTILVFQHMKFSLMLLLAQETMAKLITWWKHLKKR